MIRIVKQLSRNSLVATIVTSFRLRESDDMSPEDIASLKTTMGNALLDDGSIDFDRLREKTIPVDFTSTEDETGHGYASLASANHC